MRVDRRIYAQTSFEQETCHYQEAADVTAHNLKTAEVHYHLRDKDVIASIFKVNQDESEEIFFVFANFPKEKLGHYISAKNAGSRYGKEASSAFN